MDKGEGEGDGDVGDDDRDHGVDGDDKRCMWKIGETTETTHVVPQQSLLW